MIPGASVGGKLSRWTTIHSAGVHSASKSEMQFLKSRHPLGVPLSMFLTMFVLK